MIGAAGGSEKQGSQGNDGGGAKAPDPDPKLISLVVKGGTGAAETRKGESSAR